MSDSVEFDPAAIDRAIQQLNRVLALMDQREREVGELQHVVLPGAAPSTRAFHGLLGQSMGRLRMRHDAFRGAVENQIEELKKTKRSYLASDRAAGTAFTELGQRA